MIATLHSNIINTGLGAEPSLFSLEDIKSLPAHTVTATLCSAANRRDELCQVLPLPFIKFGGGCCGNAVWTGARLLDVLHAAGIADLGDGDGHHVVLEGLDTGPAGSHYAVSIPLQKVVDKYGDVLLAYKMNGEPLTPDHG